MFSFPGPARQFSGTHLEKAGPALIDAANRVLYQRRHGHLEKWLGIVRGLPQVAEAETDFNADAVTIGSRGDIDETRRETLRRSLMSLHPWRKGPFHIFGIEVDGEWRSNLKWARLENDIRPLRNRTVLDVGCGNGYYIYRMLGAGAEHVLGVEPSQLFTMQFNAFRNYTPAAPAAVLPLRCEEMPLDVFAEKGVSFDTVFSMGVLYHRKNPRRHLSELMRCLREGGELVLETLIIQSGRREVLVPEGRYAKMPNVRAIPSEGALRAMLEEAGLKDIRTIDVSTTGHDEQRRTKWMAYESLTEFLDADDNSKTIEGYPAPTRIILRCEK